MKNPPNHLTQTFEKVFKSLPIASYIWKKNENDFELIDANELAVNDFVYNKNAIIGSKSNEFFSNIPSIIEDLEKCLATKKSFESIILVNFDANSSNQLAQHQYTFIDDTTVLVQTKTINNSKEIYVDPEQHTLSLASFIENNPSEIAMFDNNMCFLSVSKKWMDAYKLEIPNIKGKNLYEILPEMTDDCKQVHQRCLKGNTEKREEDLFERLNGEMVWVKWEIRPWYKLSGEIGGIIAFTEEITERKRAEEKIIKDTEKLNQILENLPFGLSIEKKNYEITYFNKSLVDMLGYDIAEVPTEEVWFQKVYPNENYRNQIRKIWDDEVAKSLKTKQRCEPIESKVKCKDGSFKIIESYYVDIGDEYVTLVQDITDVKNKEFQIKDVNEVIIQQNNELLKAKKLAEESEFRLLQAQKAAKVGNWQTDLKTLEVIWSEENFHTFELDPQTFRPSHESFISFVHPEDREFVNEAFFNSFSSKEFNTIEHRILTAKGNLKYVEERWIVSFNENDEPISVFGTCQDITERKLIELKLIKSNLKLEENEQRLKLALDAAKLGVWEWNIDDGKLTWDDKMYEFYGLHKSDETINFDQWTKFLHPEDKEKATHEAIQTFENEKPFDTSFRIVREDGEIIYIKADALLIKDIKGKPIKVIGVNRDVTEKNIRQKELKENELRYRTLFENSADAILLFGDGYWLDCNERALKLFGTTKEKIIQSNPIKFSPKYQSNGILSEDDIKKRIEEVFKGNSQHFEWEHCKEDGSIFLAEVRLNLLKIDEKPYIQAIIRDITAAKTAENRLNEFRYFFENSNDLLAVTNIEGYFEIVNQKMIKTLEYSFDEITRKEYDEIIDQEFIDEARAKAVILREGLPLENLPLKMLKNNGETIWVEWNVFINEISGKFYAIGRDITERKKYEEQLALSSLIVNSSNDAILSISLDNLIISWNNGAEKIFGYKASEILGKSIFEIIPKERYKEAVVTHQKLFQKEVVINFETQKISKNGKIIDVSLTASPILDDSGNVIAISKIIRDITKQKLIEFEKSKIMNDLIQRNRDLEQFTNIVSHNLRAPVANIIGLNSYMLKKDLSPEKKNEFDIALNKSVVALDNVIRDLNNILQLRKEIDEQKVLVSFDELIEKIKTSISDQIKNNNVTFITDFNEVGEMMAIKSYLYSIFYNLITNSIKYKQPQQHPVIEIQSKIREKNIVLTFKDNGLGFDMKKNTYEIFGLYKRFHKHVEGKGLGLYMVKSQVESLGGKISVTSEINEGTEFTIEFEK